MRKVFLSIIIVVICKITIAQVPETFSYQAIVRNTGGQPIVSQSVSFRISIIKNNPSGSTVFKEKHTTTTNEFGMVTMSIGNGTDKTGDFAAIDWGADNYFMKVEIDPTGLSTYTEIGTTQLLIIPLALPAKKSKKSLIVEEDNLILTRKFIGVFIDYRHTGSEDKRINLIWIKTSMEDSYGKISAYGVKCEFSVGDRLYLKRTYANPAIIEGYWVYNIENDSSISYRVTEFQNDHKVFVFTWF